MLAHQISRKIKGGNKVQDIGLFSPVVRMIDYACGAMCRRAQPLVAAADEP